MVTLLYYARAVNPTMLTSRGSISAQQANPTEKTMQNVRLLLDYVDSHPDAILTYQASEMVLAGHINTSYLSKIKDGSRAGGNFFISNNTALTLNNGSVFTFDKFIKAVMSSASKAELGALFINRKEDIPARQALEEMGHKQPPTPMENNNTNEHGVVTNNISRKRLKSMDMSIPWL